MPENKVTVVATPTAVRLSSLRGRARLIQYVRCRRAELGDELAQNTDLDRARVSSITVITDRMVLVTVVTSHRAGRNQSVTGTIDHPRRNVGRVPRVRTGRFEVALSITERVNLPQGLLSCCDGRGDSG
jgi:hypothetical protein